MSKVLPYPQKDETIARRRKIKDVSHTIYAHLEKLSPLEHTTATVVLVVTLIFSLIGWSFHDSSHLQQFPRIVGVILFVAEKCCQATCALIIFSGIFVYFIDRAEDSAIRNLARMVSQVKKNQAIKYSYEYIKKHASNDDSWKQMMAVLTDLGRRAYGNRIKMFRRLKAYTNWFLKNNHSFIILTANGYPIGFICALPLGMEEGSNGDSHYKGNCEEFDISREMVSSGSSNLILLQGMFILPEFQNEETVKLCLECYTTLIATLLTSTDGVTIYAEPTSSSNNILFRKLGFVFKGKYNHVSKRKIYEKDFNDINDEGYEIVKMIIEKHIKSSKPFSDISYN